MYLVMIFAAAVMIVQGFSPGNRSFEKLSPPSRERIGYAAQESKFTLPNSEHISSLPGSRTDWFLVPFVLEIQTVPPLEGIPFLIDGRRFVTDEEGVVRARLWREGVFEVEVLVSEFEESDIRLEFARWDDYVFTPRREIKISSPVSMQAGFHVSYPVELHYLDLEGGNFPVERISTVELRNSLGDVLTFDGSEMQWMQSIEVLGRDFGLDPVEVVYAVQRVIVDGSNVVNRGQQRFTVTSQKAPRIELLLYPVQFTSHDALFGFSLGSGVRLEYPDGHQEVFPMNTNGDLRLDSLARGTYRSSVVGAPGLAILTTFVLSRAQMVEMIVISLLDIVVVTLMGTLIFVGLLIIGRPGLLDQLKTRVRGGVTDAEDEPREASNEEELG